MREGPPWIRAALIPIAAFEEDWMGTCDIKQNGAGVDVGLVALGPYSVNAGSRSYVRNGSAMGAERPE